MSQRGFNLSELGLITGAPKKVSEMICCKITERFPLFVSKQWKLYKRNWNVIWFQSERCREWEGVSYRRRPGSLLSSASVRRRRTSSAGPSGLRSPCMNRDKREILEGSKSRAWFKLRHFSPLTNWIEFTTLKKSTVDKLRVVFFVQQKQGFEGSIYKCKARAVDSRLFTLVYDSMRCREMVWIFLWHPATWGVLKITALWT